jgi:hypothetical protein
MKIKSNLSLIALVLFFAGCQQSFTPADADKIFPPKIGEFTRGTASRNTDAWYTTNYKKPGVDIFYGFGPDKTAEAAQKRVADKQFCNTDEAIKNGTQKILKEETLKDKSGKDVGKILVCRDTIKDPYKDTVGNYKYKITFANDKNYVLLDGKSGKLADLVEFAQALPANSQVDFAALNLNALANENSTSGASADEVAAFKAPGKIAKEPYLKGKVLIVSQTYFGKIGGDGSYIFDKQPESYGLTKDSIAETLSQADTLIQILCTKGERIGDYVTADADKKKFPAFASKCNVSVVDKTIPAVIAQKSFIGSSLAENESFTTTEKEFRAPPPTSEIQEYIKKMPKK